MRKILTLACAACVTLAAGVMVACGEEKETKDPVFYTVTFVQAGQENVVKTVSEGKSLTDIPVVQTREGYTVAWDEEDLAKLTNINANVTVNAVETANDYTVTYTFDAQLEGDIEIYANTQTATYDQAFTPYEPTLDGYDFVCWQYVNAESQTVSFASGSVWKFAKNMTFSAKFEEQKPVEHTITFVQTGFADVTKTVVNGGTLAEADIPVPQSVVGHNVVWKEADLAKLTNVTGNITVTAEVTPKEYTITYKLGTASGATITSSTQKVKYGETYNLYTPSASSDWKFVCWYIEETTTEFKNGKWDRTSDVTLVAQWVENEELWTGFY